MKLYRIKITSWTASFRYPNLISGFQPTLEVPPLSTVLGLINAAAGKYIDYENSNAKLGYYFEYGSKSVDLETIYQVELKATKSREKFPSSVVKSNIMNREFLFDCKLYVYVQDEEIRTFFQKPHFQLLLGRSNDLATVDEIIEVDLSKSGSSKNVKGQILPFKDFQAPGDIQALPRYFTDTIPRLNLGTEAYTIIPHTVKKLYLENIETFSDKIEGKEVDIYLHQLNLIHS